MKKALLNFFFPITCLHCTRANETRAFFCKGCMEHFVLMDTDKQLFALKPHYTSTLACFEDLGPAKSLSTLSPSELLEHKKVFVSLLIIQLSNASLLDSDAVLSFGSKEEAKLAKALAKELKVPFYPNYSFPPSLKGKKVLILSWKLKPLDKWKSYSHALLVSCPSELIAISVFS